MQCLLCPSETQDQIGTKDQYQVVRCHDCGLFFLNPIPSNQILNEYYNSQLNQDHYIKVAERKLKTGRHKIKRLLKYSSGNRFLDIGCNAGANVEAARRLGLDTMGIDLSQEVINNARELFPKNRFEAMDIDSLAQQVSKGLEQGFDLIFCTEVIEHTTDPHGFIKSLRAVMNPGAVLYLTTPDAGHFRVPRDFVSWKHVHAPDHICYFNRETLTKLLNDHNIEVIKFRWTTRTNLQVIAQAA